MSKLCCDTTAIHLENVNSAKKQMPSTDEIENLSLFFKAIGDETRLKIVLSLRDHELCVCDIAFLLNSTKSAISHQLKVLKERALVASRRSGKNIFYSLADSHVEDCLSIGLEHIIGTKKGD